tara:strand:+ start:667 stop:792 length:126 start_codon:yes stop_codon:yes gene_type:complete
MKYIAILFLAALALSSCKKEEAEPLCEEGGTQVQFQQEIND